MPRYERGVAGRPPAGRIPSLRLRGKPSRPAEKLMFREPRGRPSHTTRFPGPFQPLGLGADHAGGVGTIRLRRFSERLVGPEARRYSCADGARHHRARVRATWRAQAAASRSGARRHPSPPLQQSH
jgi:hypothetical protein